MKTRVVLLVEVEGWPTGAAFGPSWLSIPGVISPDELIAAVAEVRAVDRATGEKIGGYELRELTPEERERGEKALAASIADLGSPIVTVRPPASPEKA